MPEQQNHGPFARPNAYNAIPFYLGPQIFTQVGSFEFSIGSESGNAIAVTIYPLDIRGRRMNRRVVLDVIVSQSSFGPANASFSDVAVTTGTFITESPTDSVITVQSALDSTTGVGSVVLSFTTTGTTDYYIRARCGDVMVESASQLDYS